MMYCYNCGKFFPDEDVVQRRDGETALHIYCCPHCGVDDIGEAETCSLCGKDFADGETREGICLECLWNAIDYDVALAYMKENKFLIDFLLTDWFRGGVWRNMDRVDSPALDAFLEETFRRLVANDRLMGEDTFLRACRTFCLPKYPADFGSDGDDFAEWYAERQKGEKNDR